MISRRLAHRADHLFVAGVSNQHDAAALGCVPACLHVHLRHQRTCRIDRPVGERGRALVDGRRNAVRREHEDGARRRVALVVDEHRAALFELTNDMGVMDDLPSDVNGRAVQRKGAFHRLHGALHAGAIPAGRGEQDSLDQTGCHGTCVSFGALGTTSQGGTQGGCPSLGGSVATGFLLVLTADCKARNAPRFASPSACDASASPDGFQ
jgi:hypothetical protein